MNRKPIILIAGAVIFCVFSPARAESASVLLEKGIFAEQTRGDLDAAVKIYKQILADDEANRKHVARAQFRLGMCYRKQKRPAEAVAAFETVISGFGKQGKLVADARKQISQIRGSIRGAALAKIVEDAVTTISTCTETDPRVGKALASLKGLNEKAVVGELVKFLAAEKNTIRRSAIYILWKGGLDDISAAEAPLKKLCKHAEAMTRGMAALTLGGAKVASSFDLLCDMTANDTSGYVRRCAAYALGLMGRREAKAVLEKALKDTDAMVRNNAEAALTLLGLSTGPRIVKTTPATYANDVAPSVTELTATFDRTMKDKCWSWVRRFTDKFPELVGKARFDAKRKTCSVTVKLQPGKVYWVELNTPPYTSFQSPTGAIARPFILVFATRSADGKPTPIPADLLARARKINGPPPAPAAAASKLGPVPWEDGEEIVHTVFSPAGAAMGKAVYHIRTVKSGKKTLWRMEARADVATNFRQYNRTDMERASFAPVIAEIRRDKVGGFLARYASGKVALTSTASGKETTRQIDVPATVYDSEQTTYVLRRLPLKTGYEVKLPVFVPEFGSPGYVDAKVLAREAVTVGAGKFDCYKLSLTMGITGGGPVMKHTAWLSADKHRYLVQYDAGSIVTKLESVGTRREKAAGAVFTDEAAGIALTLPVGWHCYASTDGMFGKGLFVSFLPAKMESWTIMMSKPVEAADASARKLAESDIPSLKKYFKDYVIRPKSWKETKISGLPAVEFVADFVHSGAKQAEQRVFVSGPSRLCAFIFRNETETFDARKPAFDAMVRSLKIKKAKAAAGAGRK